MTKWLGRKEIKTDFFLIPLMAKSLGQIHTVSHEFPNLTTSLAADSKLLIDLPGELTRQLQHMVRMMQSFKVVGIDMSFGPIVNASGITASMSGQIQYYTPTKGRVEALKMAYKAVRRMMKLSGVDPKDAITYDFRPLIRDPADFENGADIANQASIEDNGLATCLAFGPAGSSNVFDTYNIGIQPQQTVGSVAAFPVGFDIGLRSNVPSQNWVLNQKVLLSSETDPLASDDVESIPFELSCTAADANVSLATSNDFQWRPDPALYLSILTGQLIVHIEESAAEDSAGAPSMNSTQLDIAVHVAGWKSILGSGKKRRHKRRGHHGRKRRSKK